jgi:hypothetical protein
MTAFHIASLITFLFGAFVIPAENIWGTLLKFWFIVLSIVAIGVILNDFGFIVKALEGMRWF